MHKNIQTEQYNLLGLAGMECSTKFIEMAGILAIIRNEKLLISLKKAVLVFSEFAEECKTENQKYRQQMSENNA